MDIRVTDKDGTKAWYQTFGQDAPAQAIAGFLAALIAFPTRCAPASDARPEVVPCPTI